MMVLVEGILPTSLLVLECYCPFAFRNFLTFGSVEMRKGDFSKTANPDGRGVGENAAS